MAVFRRLLRRNFGLRARIVGVVVITTSVTLGVAALVLLPRLEHSLRSAALTTLKHEVASAQRDDVFRDLGAVRYDLLTPGTIPAARKAHQPGGAAEREREAAIELTTYEASLKQRLGATILVLRGYVDQTGHGQPVLPPTGGAASSVDTASVDAAAGAPYKDAVRAYLTGKIQYSFSSDGGLVMAAIPLKNDAVLAVRKSIDEIPAVVASVRRSFEIAGTLGMLLGLLLAIPLSSTLVRRLRQLRQAALRLAVDGTGAGTEFPANRARDEVGDLARSFAIVQRRLRQQEDARRAFVATASHELRTPLASLEGMLELLAEDLEADDLDLEDASALLDRARAQSRRLARLAADLLDLSRLDAEVELRSEPVELTELGRAVLAEFELRAVERGITPVLGGTGGAAVWALADPGSIAQILRILLDNAVRVAPPGSEIMVAVTGGVAPSVQVIDQGPGVAPEDQRLIFERFMRGRETGGIGGFGLGLAIGRELAQRMGGSLRHSDGDGVGAIFTLTLRSTAAPAHAPTAHPAGV